MRSFRIDIAHCNKCNHDFLYVPGKVFSVTSKDSDLYGSPKCPTCHSYKDTHRKGRLRILGWRLEVEP